MACALSINFGILYYFVSLQSIVACVCMCVVRGAVHRAAETNNIEMMDRLLAEGCNMELESRYRETPVVVAALHECTEMVLYLMGKKANMRTKSFDGLTPFQISAKYGYPEMMKALFDEGGGEPACMHNSQSMTLSYDDDAVVWLRHSALDA